MALHRTIDDMAYIKNLEDEENLNPENPVVASQNSEPAYSGGGVASSAVTASPTGSGFVNLDKYKQANQGQSAEIAKEVGKKASTELKVAEDELNKVDTSAKGTSVSEDAIRAAGALSGGLNQSQAAEIEAARKGYQGPDKLNTSSFDAAYNSAYNKASSYGDRDVQLAALNEIFNTNELKNKGISYGSGMAALDQSLIGDQSAQIKKAVDDAAKDVNSKVSSKRSEFEQNKAKAVEESKQTWDKIQAAASQGRDKLYQQNLSEAQRKSIVPGNGTFTDLTGSLSAPSNRVLTDKGAAASLGDVVDDNELAAAGKYDSILGGRTFESLDKTYRAPTYQDIAPVNQGEIIHESVPGLDYTVQVFGPKYDEKGNIIPGTEPPPPPVEEKPKASGGNNGTLSKYKQKRSLQ